MKWGRKQSMKKYDLWVSIIHLPQFHLLFHIQLAYDVNVESFIAGSLSTVNMVVNASNVKYNNDENVSQFFLNSIVRIFSMPVRTLSGMRFYGHIFWNFGIFRGYFMIRFADVAQLFSQNLLFQYCTWHW